MRLMLTELGDDVFANLIRPRVATGLVAQGSGQANAQAVLSPVNVFTQVGAGQGAVLPGGLFPPMQIFNRGGNDLLVYPAYGSAIEALAPNAPVDIPPGGSATFTGAGSTLVVQS